MKTMAGKAGFERRLTNHSARKRRMQKLNDNNVPPTHIMQLPGHRTALCQKSSRKISRWFWATIQPHQTRRILLKLRKRCNCGILLHENSSVFSGAVFYDGHFNITINTLNKSPNTSKYSVSTVTRSYKHIKRVLDSSNEDSPTAVPFKWQFLSKLFYW